MTKSSLLKRWSLRDGKNEPPISVGQYGDVRKHGVNFLNEMDNSAAASYKKTIPPAPSFSSSNPTKIKFNQAQRDATDTAVANITKKAFLN